MKIKEETAQTINKGGEKMKIGDAVKIRECPIAELIGESAVIADLQFQEFEKYTAYPVWVEIISGEHKGKFYGFKYEEVEMLPKVYEPRALASESKEKLTQTKVIEQLEDIVKGIATVEEIAEIERVIDEAKGRILPEPTSGFWEDKIPCWEMFRCPEAMRNECPAFMNRDLPCWEIEGTYCKLYDYGAKGDGTDICQVCRVYKRWGQGEPIEIKLRGKGLDAALKSVSK